MAPASKTKLKSTSTDGNCVCPICSLGITKGVYSVGCSDCNTYFHPKCIGITTAELKTNKSFTYVCNGCKSTSSRSAAADINTSTAVLQDVVHSSATSQIVSVANNSCDMKAWFDNLATDMKKNIDEHMHKCTVDLQSTMDNIVGSFRTEFLDALRCVKDDLNICDNKVNEIDKNLRSVRNDVESCKNISSSVNNLQSKLEDMEKQNYVLQRRLNRSNIIIDGLPQGLKDISQAVLKLCSLCNVTLNVADLQHCCYFAKGKSILVKFNSVLTRDLVMANYHRANPTIKVNEVVGGELLSRVYLNDHLTPDAARLVYICRQLIRRKEMKKYKLINGDVPRVEVCFTDKPSQTLTLRECEHLFGDCENE